MIRWNALSAMRCSLQLLSRPECLGSMYYHPHIWPDTDANESKGDTCFETFALIHAHTMIVPTPKRCTQRVMIGSTTRCKCTEDSGGVKSVMLALKRKLPW